MEAVSLRLLSKNFPKLLTGFSEIVGIGVSKTEKRNLSITLPFFKTKDLDFSGLKDILTHPISFSSPFRIHLAPGTDSVVTVRSSMKARIGGWWIPDLGPLHTGSADFYQHVHRLCKQNHWNGTACDDSHLQSMPLQYYWSCWDSQAEIAVIIQDEVSYPHQLVGHWAIGVG